MLPTTVDDPADIHLQIVNTDIKPAHVNDRYGQLVRAYIKVRGRLKPAYWNISRQTIDSDAGLSTLGNTRTFSDSLEYGLDGPLAGTSLQVYCLEIQDPKYWARNFKTYWGPSYTGLLLLPFQGTTTTFQRCGLFCLAQVSEDETNDRVLETTMNNLAWFEDTSVQDITLACGEP